MARGVQFRCLNYHRINISEVIVENLLFWSLQKSVQKVSKKCPKCVQKFINTSKKRPNHRPWAETAAQPSPARLCGLPVVRGGVHHVDEKDQVSVARGDRQGCNEPFRRSGSSHSGTNTRQKRREVKKNPQHARTPVEKPLKASLACKQAQTNGSILSKASQQNPHTHEQHMNNTHTTQHTQHTRTAIVQQMIYSNSTSLRKCAHE